MPTSLAKTRLQPSPDALDLQRQRKVRLMLGLLLACSAIAVYLPSIQNGFVAWDDGKNIYENPHLGLGWNNLKWMFTDYGYVHRYLPIGWLSYSVDRALFGGGPLSYHLGNVLLHALNTVLLFVLLMRLLALATARTSSSNFKTDYRVPVAAALATLWWAINPLRVEAVAWASSRLYGVAIALMLLSLLSYLRGRSEPGPGRPGCVLLAAVLYGAALFTYPIVLGGAALFVALDFYPLRRLSLRPAEWLQAEGRAVLLEKVLFLAPGVLMLAITLWTRATNAAVGSVFDASQPKLIERAMQAAYVWSYYVWKPWSPVNLAPEYPTLLDFNPGAPIFILSALFVCALTVWLWSQRQARLPVLVLWCCHLALLVPVLGLENFRHYHTADRYSYLQGMTWAALLAGAFWLALSRRRWRIPLGAAVMGWTGICAGMIPSQINIWQSDISLHSRIVASLARHPDVNSGDRALRDRAIHETYLGQLYVGQTNFASAEICFRDAIKLNPKLVEPRARLGNLMAQENKLAEAKACFRELLAEHPDEAQARITLAVLLGTSGQLQEAARELETVLQKAPQSADAHHNLAVTLERLGDTNSARLHYTKASELRNASREQH